jgi:hypothetical protein
VCKHIYYLDEIRYHTLAVLILFLSGFLPVTNRDPGSGALSSDGGSQPPYSNGISSRYSCCLLRKFCGRCSYGLHLLDSDIIDSGRKIQIPHLLPPDSDNILHRRIPSRHLGSVFPRPLDPGCPVLVLFPPSSASILFQISFCLTYCV